MENLRGTFKTIEDLPLMLSLKDVANVLQISEPKAREIVYSEGFPIINRKLTGRRILVPKQGFINWLESQYQYENKEI